jgi:hypothetical protein
MANPINKFISSMSKARGFARPSQFEIVINPPLFKDFTSRLVAGENIQLGQNQVHVDNRVALSEMTSVTKQLVLQCSSVSMPAHDLQTQNRAYGSEPGREMVQTHGYAGTIDCSFYLSTDLREKHYFELWQSLAVDNFTHKANYYDDYIGSMEIYQLSSSEQEIGETVGDIKSVRTYGIRASEVFPKTVGAVAYGHDSANQIASLDVRFEFRQWYNIGDELGNSVFDAAYTYRRL